MKLKFALRAIILNVLALLAVFAALATAGWSIEFILYLGRAEEDRLEPVGFFTSLPGTELITGLVGFGIVLASVVLGLIFFNLALLRSSRVYWLLSVFIFCLGIFVINWRWYSYPRLMVES